MADTGIGPGAADQPALDEITKAVAGEDYKMKTLIREVVLSTPFRNLQREAGMVETEEEEKRAPRRLLGTK